MSGEIRMLDLNGRTIGIFGMLDRETCLAASEAILRISSAPSRRAIHLYLGCTGGDIGDVLMVLDCLKSQRRQIHTYAMTTISGMGLLLLAAGDKRYALPHAKINTDGLGRSRGIGFETIAPHRADRVESIIQKHLDEKLGTFAVKALFEKPTLDLEEALQIGLLNQVIDSKKRSHGRVRNNGGRSL